MPDNLGTNNLNQEIDVYKELKGFFLERIKILEEKGILGDENGK